MWGEKFFHDEKIGKYLVRSLCPVCSKLYEPLFYQFIRQEDKTIKILEDYISIVLNHESPIYGFSVTTGNAISSIYAAKRLKEERPDSLLIFGGAEASLNYRAKLFLQLPFVDLVVYHSEGEIPMWKILSNCKDDIKLQSSPGIAFQHEKEIILTKPPENLDLNKLPIPKYDLLENFDAKDAKILDILTAKGCSNRCVFCNENSIWGGFMGKSPRVTCKEIDYYTKNYGIFNFELVDNAFNLSDGFEKALDLLDSSNIKINWGGNCEISRITKKKIFNYVDSGLERCYFGLESASKKILNLMKKKINVENFANLLRDLATTNVHSYLYMMIGFPDEKKEDFEKTIEFLNQNNNYIDNIIVSVFSLMKSSPMFSSSLINPIPLGLAELNAWTYETFDGVSHEDRLKRFLTIKELLFNSSVR